MASSSFSLSANTNPVFEFLTPYVHKPINTVPSHVIDQIQALQRSSVPKEQKERIVAHVVAHNMQQLKTLHTKSPTYSWFVPGGLVKMTGRIGTIPASNCIEKNLGGTSQTVFRILGEDGFYIRKGGKDALANANNPFHANEIKILCSLPPNNHTAQFLLLDLCNRIILRDEGSQNLLDWIDTKKSKDASTQYGIARALLNGLAFLDGLKIIHRDLKLENVIVHHPEKPNNPTCCKIIDFQFAYRLTPQDQLTPPHKKWCGTFLYRTPEDCQNVQCYDEVEVKLTNDIWALGVVLYELLTPFPLMMLINRSTPQSTPQKKYEAVKNQFVQYSHLILKNIELATTIHAADTLATRQIKSLARDCLQFDPQNRPTATMLQKKYSQNEGGDSVVPILQKTSPSSSTESAP